MLTSVVNNLSQPLFVTHAGDGSDRLFVVERGGLIKVQVDGQLRATPFLDVRTLLRTSGSEQGLLGLAFHPDYVNNGLFYVYYTASSGGANTLARYRVSTDAQVADPASGLVLLSIPDTRDNHNGGMLAFGQDGYLYVSTGDGGGVGDPDNNGQNRQALLGKLLRLDVNTGALYGIPASNPFVGQADARGEIWAYGLRNPWRFSFDRATGDLFIGDVGQNTYEEINYQPFSAGGGQNYGWRRMEGLHCYDPNPCDQTGLTPPVAEYTQVQGNCSITGGYVYRGRRIPGLVGAYVYGDYCSGRIWALRRTGATWMSSLLLDSTAFISSFGEDRDGEVYVTDLNAGRVYRIEDPTVPPPTPLPPLGGRGLTLQAGPPSLTWTDGATETGYVALRWASTGEFAFLPLSGTPLWSTATAYADTSATPAPAYCYLVMPVGGRPPGLSSVLGLSDFLCWWPNTATGTSPPRPVSIRLDQSNQAVLGWSAPGPQDTYALVAFTFDGAAPRVTMLPGTQTTASDDMQGKSTCYAVVALQGKIGIGSSDLICGVPAISTLGTSAGARRNGPLDPRQVVDRLTAATRHLFGLGRP